MHEFFLRIFLVFLRWWKVRSTTEEIIDSNVDLIIPISFSTLRNSLVFGTEANVKLACKWTKKFPSAKIIFSSCSYTFPGAELVEDELRLKIFLKNGKRPLIADSMVNSVDEAMRIADTLLLKRVFPECILIIDGEIHSRSSAYIYGRLFPHSKILIDCTPYSLEYQPDHNVKSQRTLWRWLFSNIARQFALRILPLSLVRKIQRRSK